jgi:hypothetical protein
MVHDDIFSQEFHDTIVRAGIEARQETLRAGVPVCYLDVDGTNTIEMPDGRKFEIRFVSHAPGEPNYEIVREIRSAA